VDLVGGVFDALYDECIHEQHCCGLKPGRQAGKDEDCADPNQRGRKELPTVEI
jgi:hypothetical protein